MLSPRHPPARCHILRVQRIRVYSCPLVRAFPVYGSLERVCQCGEFAGIVRVSRCADVVVFHLVRLYFPCHDPREGPRVTGRVVTPVLRELR